jgi:hypothetical protein
MLARDAKWKFLKCSDNAGAGVAARFLDQLTAGADESSGRKLGDVEIDETLFRPLTPVVLVNNGRVPV